MTDCVQHMLSGCDSENKTNWKDIDPKVEVYFSAVADHCPMTKMLLSKARCFTTRTCDVHKATMECFPYVDPKDFSSSACS